MLSSAILAAAFAGCALSSPVKKRDTVVEIDTVTDVSYVTDYVTVVAGAPSSTVAAAPSSIVETSVVVYETTVQANTLWGNVHSWTSAYSSASSSVESVVSSVASSTSVYVAPSSTSVYVAPISTSVYVAPASSSSTSISSAAATSSAAEAASTTSATDRAASSSGSSYEDIVIAHHNVHRANHSATSVTWSSSLAATAQEIAASCVYAHNVTAGGGGYGQNIAAGVESTNISAVITDLFYNGEVNNFADLYGQADPDMSNFENWGHFSQLVWKDTTEVGCYTQDCSSSGLANTGEYVSPYFTVCNYGPPGNYAGEYADNIGDSLLEATVQWNFDL